jgi:hypothetical protein
MKRRRSSWQPTFGHSRSLTLFAHRREPGTQALLGTPSPEQVKVRSLWPLNPLSVLKRFVCWADILADVLGKPNVTGCVVGPASRGLWPWICESSGCLTHKTTWSGRTGLGSGEGAKAAGIAPLVRIARGLSEHYPCWHRRSRHNNGHRNEQDGTSHCQPAFSRFVQRIL